MEGMNMNQVKLAWSQLWKEEEGIGTLEIIMIIAVIVVIAIAFRRWIMKWIYGLFQQADTSVNDFSTLDPNSIGPQTTSTP
jgi:Flp pilus assembly pilin Flp